ncbi:MAG: hypothetical protein GHCLOJNM_03665 [bacterium]|nr:hypothetical protein [bacterium]
MSLTTRCLRSSRAASLLLLIALARGLGWCEPRAAGELVPTASPVVPLWALADVTAHAEIISEVSAALVRAEYQPLICATTAELPEDGSPAILIAPPERLMGLVSASELNFNHPEGYLVRKARDRPFVIVTAIGERGLLYGAQELAERIALRREYPEIFPREGRPFLDLRAFGIDWPGGKEGGEVFDSAPFPWGFTRHLARNRYNLLALHYSGRASELLESSGPLGERAHRRLRNLLREARKRLIEVVLCFDPDSDLETPLEFLDSPLRRREAWSASVIELARAFPNLQIGLRPADENRARVVGDCNQWFDGFISPWLSERPYSEVLLSGAGFDPLVFETEIARHLPAPAVVALKWCGDHPEACLAPLFLEEEWVLQQPQDYRILWVMDDQDVRCMRSAYFERARQIVKRMGEANRVAWSAGFLFQPRGEELGPETLNRESVAERIPWKFGYQKHWYRHALWGRLGYDPRLGIEDFAPFFTDGFGPEVGAALIEEETAGEEILWRVSRFHWRYSSEDWYPEACVAPGDGGPRGILGNRTGPIYRDRGEWEDPFESILEFAFSLTADPRELSIVESAGYELSGVRMPAQGPKRLTPPQVAEILRRHCARLEAIVGRLDRLSQDSKALFTARHMAADLALQRLLGVYYRSKILAAHDLLLALCLDSEKLRENARQEIERGLAAWRAFVERADRLYHPPPQVFGATAEWRDLIPSAERDLAIIRTHPAFSRSSREQPVYGPFVAGSSEVAEFEARIVRGTEPLPNPSFVFHIPSFYSENSVEQGWLDILNHYAGYLDLERATGSTEGEVLWIPVPIPDTIKGFMRLRLVSGAIDEVVWGGRTVLDLQEGAPAEFSSGVRLAGPPDSRLLWIRSNRPAPRPEDGRLEWGFALALQPDLPFVLEEAGWEPEGLVVRVRSQLLSGRLDNIRFRALPVGEGWETPPQDPLLLSLAGERTFLIPCRANRSWAALRLEAEWRGELVRLDVFPPLHYSHVALFPGSEGALPRLVETPAGWCASTSVRDWQNALLFRVNETYLQAPRETDSPRALTVEWLPGLTPGRLVAEYPSTRQGAPARSVFETEGMEGWIRVTFPLPDLLEHPSDESGILIRLSREDHRDLWVREVVFE